MNSESSENYRTLRIYPESAEPIFANVESRRFSVSAKVYFIERRSYGKNILGRDYSAIKDEWLDIQHMGVDIVIIDTPILNTKEKSDLEKNLICSIVFELLAYTAEKERRKIRIRQSEGIRLALDKGVKFGRPETTLPDNYAEVIDLWHSNQITAVEAMKRLDMKKTTFYKLARRLTNK